MQVGRDFFLSQDRKKSSGERVRNTWAICLKVGDSSPKGELIPHVMREDIFPKSKPGQPGAF
jgi:hypothetical protein